MKHEKFWDAVGEINDRYITEAHAPERKRRPRLRRLLLAAACVAMLAAFAGGGFAATRWFRYSGGLAPSDRAAGGRTGTEFVLENTKKASFVGFRLNGTELSKPYAAYRMSLWEALQRDSRTSEAAISADELASAMVHYRAEAADGEILIVKVEDRSQVGYYSYFTRYDTTVVREDVLAGMDVVWLRVENPSYGRLHCLLCRSRAMNCTLMISSNRGFEKPEAVAEALTLVDSGVPISQSSTQTVYCFRAPEAPEGAVTETSFTLAHEMRNWTQKDPEAELADYVTFVYYAWRSEQAHLLIQVREAGYSFEDNEAYVPVKNGAVNGHAAIWYEKPGPDGKPSRKALVLSFGPEGRTLVLEASASCLERQPELLEALGELIELTAVEFVDPPPREFSGLAASPREEKLTERGCRL